MIREVQILQFAITLTSFALTILILVAVWRQEKQISWLKATVQALQQERNFQVIMLAGKPDGLGGKVLWSSPAIIGQAGESVSYRNGRGQAKLLMEDNALPSELAGRDVVLCIYDPSE